VHRTPSCESEGRRFESCRARCETPANVAFLLRGMHSEIGPNHPFDHLSFSKPSRRPRSERPDPGRSGRSERRMGRHSLPLQMDSCQILRAQQDPRSRIPMLSSRSFDRQQSFGSGTRRPALISECSRAFSDELLLDPIDHLTRNVLSPWGGDDLQGSYPEVVID